MTPTREQPAGTVDIGAPGLAAISFDEDGGGVAYVARLQRAAMTALLSRDVPTFALAPRRQSLVSHAEALAFAVRALRANASRRHSWLMFGHPGIADVQRFVPAAIRKPFAVQLHGTDAWECALSRSVNLATLRLAPSEYTVRRTRDAHPWIGPIAVCPHGLLPEAENACTERADAELLQRVGRRAALIVGRVWSSERGKGHDQLLECWPTVRSAVPDAQLVIAGSGDDVPRLQAKAALLGVAHAVLFTGYVSHATRDALLRRAAVFAMPSRQEGFGLAYLEAMRVGTPCVGATNDAAGEPIAQGETGILVQQADLAALSAALVGILSNDDLRHRLGEAGRRRYYAHYTFERYRDRLGGFLASHFGWRG